ncbi:MAG: hypothetical protein H4O13_02675 [Xanthomonadales bacterium]|nr:hypothetical protein [Xanthomonadales bacterium]
MFRCLKLSMPVALALAACTVHAAAPRPAAPSPDCLDARQVDRVFPVSAWQLAIVQADGRRFRVELDAACPAVLSDDARLSLLSNEGWACGGAREFVVDASSGTRCGIAALAPADEREFAALLRDAGRRDSDRLAAVEVRASAPRAFRGTHDHCFAARHVRAWSESGDALEVEVSAPRSGGNSRYRIELGEVCPDLGRAVSVGFRSGTDNGVICGNVGDRVELIDVGLMPVTALGSRCSIREVFPIAQVAR